MISKSFEKIKVGDVDTTEPRTVTEKSVREFAELTWDRHPLHLDPAYAAQTRFGGQIAHGALMLSLLLGLVKLDPRYVQCFYGLDDLKFRVPTYFGDIVRASSEVTEVRPRPDGQTAVVTCRGELKNQDDTTVLTGLFSFLVGGESTPASQAN
ncbi:MaoC/PaaZ C-terminal domain-containing protein [Rhodococcus wratislaviensis]|uniref:MaoC family dehydratase n=1 Tax=Rhodococcus wratislaviensis TaxID=44752 RepID=UPI000F5761C6|nr:MaoC/PaaZ C-terminal domain-containing protein [Rhodococcus wratislaviensis]